MNQDERTILPVLPLDDAVVLPGMSVTFPVTTQEQAEALDGAVEGRIVLVPRIDGRFASYGAIAAVMGEVNLPDGTRTPAPRPTSWRASTARWSRRSPTCAAIAAGSRTSSPASGTRASWPTRPATPPRSPSSASWSCSRRPT